MSSQQDDKLQPQRPVYDVKLHPSQDHKLFTGRKLRNYGVNSSATGEEAYAPPTDIR